MLNSLVDFSLSCQSGSKIVMVLMVIKLKTDGLCEMLDGLVDSPEAGDTYSRD